uniref:Uncharacterized protein n=1 Tax=Steinernema glaseri TaxID=37863 RepID=A0A1I8ADR6_9BILA
MYLPKLAAGTPPITAKKKVSLPLGRSDAAAGSTQRRQSANIVRNFVAASDSHGTLSRNVCERGSGLGTAASCENPHTTTDDAMVPSFYGSSWLGFRRKVRNVQKAAIEVVRGFFFWIFLSMRTDVELGEVINLSAKNQARRFFSSPKAIRLTYNVYALQSHEKTEFGFIQTQRKKGKRGSNDILSSTSPDALHPLVYIISFLRIALTINYF